jgi:hypothetical protein
MARQSHGGGRKSWGNAEFVRPEPVERTEHESRRGVYRLG